MDILKHTQDPEKEALRSPRRKFLAKSAGWLAGAATACTVGLPRLFGGEVAKPGRNSDMDLYELFDCHLHGPAESGEQWQWHKVTHNFEDFVRFLDKTGVKRGIINSQRSYAARPEEFIAGNREVARYVEKYKGRFMGACVVNPQFIEEALGELEYCRKQLGFVWVGELCNYMVPYEYTIREFDMLVDQVKRLNMVLSLHTEQGEMKYIADKFPDATIAFAHFGDDHEYEDIFKRIDLVARNPNFYLDTSGYGHDRVGVLEYAVSAIGPDRVLFGSDFSINDPGTVIARIKNAFLTEEQKQKIFAGNLETLLEKVKLA
jgi:predicted TIM-barrel fold metal-dependent hydrolase